MKTYDVVIIGGGIMGCASAYELAGRGLRVAVVEKRLVGEGPTGHSSAILRTHYSNELTTRMAQHGLEVYRDFEERLGSDCGFHQVGFLVLAAEADRPGIEANVALQRRLGVKSEMLQPEALDELLPGLVKQDLVAGAWEPKSGYADAYLAVTGYARAMRQRGVELLQETEVTGIRFDGDRVAGVETSAGPLAAPVVLNAAGAWGARVAAMAGVEVPIASCRVQVAFYRRPSDVKSGFPVVGDFLNAVYFRPEGAELTLVGLIDPSEAEARVDPDDFARSVDYAFQAEAGEKLCRRLPAMAEAGVERGYASLYAITPDWHPIVDELIPESGFYVCSGFSGHGFKLGPAVGVMVADLVTGEKQPRFDPSLFRLGRYAEKKTIGGEYEYSIVG